MNKRIMSIFMFGAFMCCAGCEAQKTRQTDFHEKAGGIFEQRDSGKKFTFANSTEIVSLDTVTNISFQDFEEFRRIYTQNSDFRAISMKLTPLGSQKLLALTTKNQGRQIYFVIKNTIIFAAAANELPSTKELELTIVGGQTIDSLLEYLEKP